jgi:hypothetical protein
MTTQANNGGGDGAGSGDGANANSAGAGDSANQNQNQNGGNAAGANANAGNQNNDGGSNFDPEKDLTAEQWQAIYGSGRFKQLNERAKQADSLQKQQEETERKQLEEQGKWQELAQKNADQATQYKSAALNAKVEAVAAKLGSVDPEAVAALLDKSAISIDDNLNVTGVEEAVNALKDTKPYLFNSSDNNNGTKRVGSPTNPATNNTGFKFKMSEIKNPVFYREHATEIKQAIANGQVDKDS